MPDCLSWLFLLLSTVTLVVCAQQQIILESTNSDIVYSPPLCNPADTGCLSPWSVFDPYKPPLIFIVIQGKYTTSLALDFQS